MKRDSLTWEPPAAWFAHARKTGGTSLADVMREAYGTRNSLILYPNTLATRTIDDLRNLRFYHDLHNGQGMLEAVGRTDLFCFTLLRDPVERAASRIFALQRSVQKNPRIFDPEFLRTIAPLLNTDLTTCIDPHAFHTALDSQIAMFGVRQDVRPLFKGHPAADSGATLRRPYRLPTLDDPNDEAEALRRAQKWLSEMQFVGINEHYEESVHMILTMLGIPKPKLMPRYNQSTQRKFTTDRYRRTLPADVVAQLEELTQADRELYAYAADLFHRRHARFVAHHVRTYSIAPRLRLWRDRIFARRV